MLLYGQSLAGAKAFAEELRQQVEAMDTGSLSCDNFHRCDPV